MATTTQLILRGKASAYDMSDDGTICVAAPGCLTFFNVLTKNKNLGAPYHVLHYEQPQPIDKLKYQRVVHSGTAASMPIYGTAANKGMHELVGILRAGIVSIWEPFRELRPLVGLFKSSSAMTDLDWCYHNPNLLSTGCSGGVIRVWDIRMKTNRRNTYNNMNHNSAMQHMSVGRLGTINTVAWSPTSPHYLSCVCNDNRVMIFDTRMTSNYDSVLGASASTSKHTHTIDNNNVNIGEKGGASMSGNDKDSANISAFTCSSTILNSTWLQGSPSSTTNGSNVGKIGILTSKNTLEVIDVSNAVSSTGLQAERSASAYFPFFRSSRQGSSWMVSTPLGSGVVTCASFDPGHASTMTSNISQKEEKDDGSSKTNTDTPVSSPFFEIRLHSIPTTVQESEENEHTSTNRSCLLTRIEADNALGLCWSGDHEQTLTHMRDLSTMKALVEGARAQRSGGDDEEMEISAVNASGATAATSKNSKNNSGLSITCLTDTSSLVTVPIPNDILHELCFRHRASAEGGMIAKDTTDTIKGRQDGSSGQSDGLAAEDKVGANPNDGDIGVVSAISVSKTGPGNKLMAPPRYSFAKLHKAVKLDKPALSKHNKEQVKIAAPSTTTSTNTATVPDTVISDTDQKEAAEMDKPSVDKKNDNRDDNVTILSSQEAPPLLSQKNKTTSVSLHWQDVEGHILSLEDALQQGMFEGLSVGLIDQNARQVTFSVEDKRTDHDSVTLLGESNASVGGNSAPTEGKRTINLIIRFPANGAPTFALRGLELIRREQAIEASLIQALNNIAADYKDLLTLNGNVSSKREDNDAKAIVSAENNEDEEGGFLFAVAKCFRSKCLPLVNLSTASNNGDILTSPIMGLANDPQANISPNASGGVYNVHSLTSFIDSMAYRVPCPASSGATWNAKGQLVCFGGTSLSRVLYMNRQEKVEKIRRERDQLIQDSKALSGNVPALPGNESTSTENAQVLTSDADIEESIPQLASYPKSFGDMMVIEMKTREQADNDDDGNNNIEREDEYASYTLPRRVATIDGKTNSGDKDNEGYSRSRNRPVGKYQGSRNKKSTTNRSNNLRTTPNLLRVHSNSESDRSDIESLLSDIELEETYSFEDNNTEGEMSSSSSTNTNRGTRERTSFNASSLDHPHLLSADFPTLESLGHDLDQNQSRLKEQMEAVQRMKTGRVPGRNSILSPNDRHASGEREREGKDKSDNVNHDSPSGIVVYQALSDVPQLVGALFDFGPLEGFTIWTLRGEKYPPEYAHQGNLGIPSEYIEGCKRAIVACKRNAAVLDSNDKVKGYYPMSIKQSWSLLAVSLELYAISLESEGSADKEGASMLNWKNSILGTRLLLKVLSFLVIHKELQLLSSILCILGGSEHALLLADIRPDTTKYMSTDTTWLHANDDISKKVKINYKDWKHLFDMCLTGYASILEQWGYLLQAVEVRKRLGYPWLGMDAELSLIEEQHTGVMAAGTSNTQTMSDAAMTTTVPTITGTTTTTTTYPTSSTVVTTTNDVEDKKESNKEVGSYVSITIAQTHIPVVSSSTGLCFRCGNQASLEPSLITTSNTFSSQHTHSSHNRTHSGGNHNHNHAHDHLSCMDKEWACKTCTRYNAFCTLCHLPLKAAAMVCIGCGHGGHFDCMKAWFSSSVECATGCGCRCAELSVNLRHNKAFGSAQGTGKVDNLGNEEDKDLTIMSSDSESSEESESDSDYDSYSDEDLYQRYFNDQKFDMNSFDM